MLRGGERGRQHLIGALAGEVAPRARHRGAVDRVVDRLLERDLARPLERRPVVIEGHELGREPRADEEPAAWFVDPVRLGKIPIRARGEYEAEVDAVFLNPGQAVPVVSPAA